MIKSSIYVRDISEKEKKILNKIAEENKINTGVEVFKFIVEDYNAKKTALSYQSKVLEKLKLELEELKENYTRFVELEQKKCDALEELKNNLNL